MIANSKLFSLLQSSPFILDCYFSRFGTTSFPKSANLHVSHPSKHVTFDISPPRSSYKALFQGIDLGEALKRMLLSKAVPKGLKSVECEHGVWGKNSPIRHIPELDPIQEALETKHQPMSFELSLPSGSEMRMVRWVSKTPEHFLIHVWGVIHAIKEIALDTKFQGAAKVVKSAILEIDLTKMHYKDELKKDKLKKREKDDSSQQAVGAGKAASDKAKKSKRTEGDDSPPAKVIAAKAALDVAQKARNKVQE